jgi:hypothetical protein
LANNDDPKADETLRWPINLDRAGIEGRLIEVRENARRFGMVEIVRLFENLGSMSAAQIGTNVVGALTLLQSKPGHRPLTMQLEMVAMNLKNLQKPKKGK